MGNVHILLTRLEKVRGKSTQKCVIVPGFFWSRYLYVACLNEERSMLIESKKCEAIVKNGGKI